MKRIAIKGQISRLIAANILGFVGAVGSASTLGCNRESSRQDAETATMASVARVQTPKRYRIQESYPAEALAAQASEVLGKQLPATDRSSARVQSVILWHSRWVPGQTVTVAFLGGSPTLRTQIADAVGEWSNAANIHFDFWTDRSRQRFREWSPKDVKYAADIRIEFDSAGYWSLIGREALLEKPGVRSMNLGGFDIVLPDYWRATTLHEFGHALGFMHEHQSPESHCDAEFRWEDDPGYMSTTDNLGQFTADPSGRNPGIYTVLGGPPNTWPRKKVDQNLRQFALSSDLRRSQFDRASIMKYYFDDWMFRNGRKSSCYSEENNVLSTQDKIAASQTHPNGDAALTESAGSQKLSREEIDFVRLSASALARLQAVIANSNKTYEGRGITR